MFDEFCGACENAFEVFIMLKYFILLDKEENLFFLPSTPFQIKNLCAEDNAVFVCE
jgi:hypothetical protein